MYQNPFEKLGPPTPKVRGEEVTGQFSCDKKGCRRVAKEARYIREHQMLTWKCPDGHICHIEGFRLD